MDLDQPPSAPTLDAEDRRTASFLSPHPATPGLSRVHADPPIWSVPSFLSEAECALLLEAGRPGLHRSIVVDPAAGKAPAPSRTSSSCYLLKSDTAWLAARVEALTGKPQAMQEPPQVAHYAPGEFYLPHFDAFDLTSASGRECVASGGQRVATVLIYLNTLPEGSGGCTAFPKLNLRVAPTRGTAIVFFPCSLGECVCVCSSRPAWVLEPSR